MIAKLLLAFTLTAAAADTIQPGEPFDYPEQAFYPKRWTEAKLDLDMIPWEGKNITFVTKQGFDPDPKVMTRFIGQLDKAWELYHELTDYTPVVFKNHKKKGTVVALPANHLSCGYGCGYIGSTGIEMTRFYSDHYPAITNNESYVPHAYFYEMGRNYYGFGQRHNCFTTGFAVFMRYVCLDSLGLDGKDERTKKVIFQAIDLWEKSDMSFVAGFTDKAGTGEKGNRLFDEKGKAITPTDQNVLYASLLLKLRKEHGGDVFVKRFYTQVSDCPSVRPVDEDNARQQCVNLMICASIAAKTNLAQDFRDKYRLKIDDATYEKLAKIDWNADQLKASTVIKEIQ